LFTLKLGLRRLGVQVQSAGDRAKVRRHPPHRSTVARAASLAAAYTTRLNFPHNLILNHTPRPPLQLASRLYRQRARLLNTFDLYANKPGRRKFNTMTAHCKRFQQLSLGLWRKYAGAPHLLTSNRKDNKGVDVACKALLKLNHQDTSSPG
jgi:hypothetical protein